MTAPSTRAVVRIDAPTARTSRYASLTEALMKDDPPKDPLARIEDATTGEVLAIAAIDLSGFVCTPLGARRVQREVLRGAA